MFHSNKILGTRISNCKKVQNHEIRSFFIENNIYFFKVAENVSLLNGTVTKFVYDFKNIQINVQDWLLDVLKHFIVNGTILNIRLNWKHWKI